MFVYHVFYSQLKARGEKNPKVIFYILKSTFKNVEEKNNTKNVTNNLHSSIWVISFGQ